MTPLTEKQIRDSFVNTTRREAAQATLPDLPALPWDALDLVGWRDRKAPLSAYVVLELDGAPTGVLLRAADRRTGRPRRKGLCSWCEDVLVTEDVSLYVARRAGAPGRQGNTLGTLVCTDFRCSAHVRRRPTPVEAATEDAAAQLVERRVAGLRERSARFVREVASTR